MWKEPIYAIVITVVAVVFINLVLMSLLLGDCTAAEELSGKYLLC